MTLKRSLSLLLATLMLTSALAACATDTESPTDTAPGGTTASTETDAGPRDNLPDGLDYGGETITFYQYTDGAPLYIDHFTLYRKFCRLRHRDRERYKRDR